MIKNKIQECFYTGLEDCVKFELTKNQNSDLDSLPVMMLKMESFLIKKSIHMKKTKHSSIMRNMVVVLIMVVKQITVATSQEIRIQRKEIKSIANTTNPTRIIQINVDT
ncbi:hypothetical protein DMUE_0258 [Dictyocoela muelleri]|nr:hypothetical protein DMUE_0258 [Dictyocoela muelleri]